MHENTFSWQKNVLEIRKRRAKPSRTRVSDLGLSISRNPARHRSPHTNGVVERWFESLKYERLYREDIASGLELADSVADFINES